MKVHYNPFKILAVITLMLLSFQNLLAQTVFSENMGSPIASPTSIVANVFQNSNTLTYSNGAQTSADIRTTLPSSGYAGASGTGSVWFISTSRSYGFSIEGINASSYASLSLQFGYRKQSATAYPTLSIDYWNGVSWITIPTTPATLFNVVSTAQTGWYLSSQLALPPDALINGLKIRFVKTGSIAIRIDDVLLSDTSFAQVAPICSGTALAPLPTTTSGGITGTWSPALNNTTTTTYTFTPDAGQNARSTIMTIVVNPLPTATISGTTSTCINFPASNITFTGANGTSRYKFTYKINNGTPLTVTSPAGSNSATVVNPISTTALTNDYTLLSVEDVTTGCSQIQAGTATVAIGVCTALDNLSRGNLGDLNQILKTFVVSGATTYRYEITNMTTNVISTFERIDSNRSILALTQLETISTSPTIITTANPLQTITYGTTYSIKVAVIVNTVLYPYGPAYEVTTPANIPQTQLSRKYCGSTITSLTEPVYTNPVYAANRFKFKVNGGEIENEEIERTGQGLSLTNLTQGAILYNTGYLVNVKASKDGGITYPTGYGTACFVYTPVIRPFAPIIGLTKSNSIDIAIDTTDLNSTVTTYALLETPASKIVQANDDCEGILPDFISEVNASDNSSSNLVITQSPTAGTLVSIGTTSVVITVTDASNNSTTCSTSFTTN